MLFLAHQCPLVNGLAAWKCPQGTLRVIYFQIKLQTGVGVGWPGALINSTPNLSSDPTDLPEHDFDLLFCICISFNIFLKFRVNVSSFFFSAASLDHLSSFRILSVTLPEPLFVTNVIIMQWYDCDYILPNSQLKSQPPKISSYQTPRPHQASQKKWRTYNSTHSVTQHFNDLLMENG